MIRIITESTCDITFEEAKELNLHMYAMPLSFGDETFYDKVTITTGEFYEKLAASDVLPTTALITPSQFIEMFDMYPDEPIICLLISKKLSGTFNSACVAVEECGRKDIYVIDGHSVTIGNQLLIREACRLRDEGKSAEEIVDIILKLSDKVEITALIETLEYLVKGGRISGVSGFLGGMLNLKPIIRVADGVVSTIGKQRGSAKAFEYVKQEVLNRYDSTMPVIIGYSQDSSRMQDMAKTLNQPEDTAFTEIGSVIGVHAGPGIVGVAYFKKDEI